MSIYAGGGNLGTLIVLRWQQSLNGFLSAVWPDLAKTPHFGHILKAFDQLLRVWWVFDKILNLLWQNLCAIGQILIAENVPKENKSFSHLDTLLECFLVYPYSSHCTYTVHMPMMLTGSFWRQLEGLSVWSGWCYKTFFGGNLENLDFPLNQNSKNRQF